MMRWYLIALIFLLDEVHLKVAMGYSVDIDDQRLDKRGSKSAQSQFQNKLLAAHNTYRAAHCAPALIPDDGLSQTAQTWAEKLASTNTFAHSGTPGVGENIYMGGSGVDAQAVVDMWYAEGKNYSYPAGQFGMDTGHFTQVVWKGTKSLGAGYATTSNGQTAYVVAQYSPPGNYIGIFTTNVLPQGSC